MVFEKYTILYFRYNARALHPPDNVHSIDSREERVQTPGQIGPSTPVRRPGLSGPGRILVLYLPAIQKIPNFHVNSGFICGIWNLT